MLKEQACLQQIQAFGRVTHVAVGSEWFVSILTFSPPAAWIGLWYDVLQERSSKGCLDATLDPTSCETIRFLPEPQLGASTLDPGLGVSLQPFGLLSLPKILTMAQREQEAQDILCAAPLCPMKEGKGWGGR